MIAPTAPAVIRFLRLPSEPKGGHPRVVETGVWGQPDGTAVHKLRALDPLHPARTLPD
jgi:hypothetical protein